MYDILLQKDMSPQELALIRSGLRGSETIYAYNDGSISYDNTISTFANNQELMELLSQSLNTYLVVYQRAAAICSGWEHSIFPKLDATTPDSPDIIGTLTTHSGAKLSAIINHMKVDEFEAPKEMTIPNLNAYIQQTNRGCTLRVPVLDSPMYVVKRSFFMQNTQIWGNFSHSNRIVKCLAQDTLAHELST